jgi:hypothetical protein
MTSITIPIKLHDAQRQIFLDPHRFRVTCNGRRFGKTALGVNELIIRALSYTGDYDPAFPVTVLGVLPSATQARTVLWKPLYNVLTSKGFSHLVEPKGINKTSMSITLINKVTIKIVGANDNGGDSLRGMKLLFVLLDEMQDIKAEAFWEVIRPAMSDTEGSRALLTGTPKGKQNVLYDMKLLADSDPEWAFFSFPTWANPVISADEIAKARASLPARIFSQEYEANFVDFPGKFYSELNIDNKYYGDLPKFDLTIMGVDFGDIHPSLNVLGRSKRQWYYLEGYSPNADKRSQQPITDPVFHANVKRLVKKWSVKAIYADPSRPSAILAIRNLGDEPGYRNCVAGYNRIAEGISQVHALIAQNNLLFTTGHNDKVSDSLDGMDAYLLVEAYHRKVGKDGIFTDEPEDGYFSHTNDGLRYALALSGGAVLRTEGN